MAGFFNQYVGLNPHFPQKDQPASPDGRGLGKKKGGRGKFILPRDFFVRGVF
jgi:hypothetical protein